MQTTLKTVGTAPSCDLINKYSAKLQLCIYQVETEKILTAILFILVLTWITSWAFIKQIHNREQWNYGRQYLNCHLTHLDSQKVKKQNFYEKQIRAVCYDKVDLSVFQVYFGDFINRK